MAGASREEGAWTRTLHLAPPAHLKPDDRAQWPPGTVGSAAWRHHGRLKDGKKGKFMSGETDVEIPAGSRLFVFKNDHKQGDRDPDYVLHAAPDQSQGQGPSQAGQQHGDNQDGGSDIPW